ncbi:MAG: hydrogenase maturation nickel metallochaperone HypA [Bacteroidales bacterium]
MHELSIVMSIIDIAEGEARKAEASAITEIELEIGQFSGVEKDALDFAIEAGKKGTMLEEAEWVVHHIRGEAVCSECGTQFNPDELFSPCPSCGSPFHEWRKGKELRVKSIKVN